MTMNRNRLATLTELSEPGSRGSSFEEELSNEVAAAFTNALEVELRSLSSQDTTKYDNELNVTGDETQKDEDPPPSLHTPDIISNSTASISNMYPNLVIPAAIKRNESDISTDTVLTKGTAGKGVSGSDVTESFNAAVFKPISDDEMDASPTPYVSSVAFELPPPEDGRRDSLTAHARRASFREEGKTFSSRIELIENELHIDVDNGFVSPGNGNLTKNINDDSLGIHQKENMETQAADPIASSPSNDIGSSANSFEPVSVDINFTGNEKQETSNDNNEHKLLGTNNHTDDMKVLEINVEQLDTKLVCDGQTPSLVENGILEYSSSEKDKLMTENHYEKKMSVIVDIHKNENKDICIEKDKDKEYHNGGSVMSAEDDIIDATNEIFTLEIRRSTADETPLQQDLNMSPDIPYDMSRDNNLNVSRDNLHDSGTDISNDEKDNVTTLRLIEEIKDLLWKPSSRKASVSSNNGEGKQTVTDRSAVDDELEIINEIRDILSKTYDTKTTKSSDECINIDNRSNKSRTSSFQNDSNFYQKGIEYEERERVNSLYIPVDEAEIRVDQAQSLYASNPFESFEVERQGCIETYNGDISESISVEEEIRMAETMSAYLSEDKHTRVEYFQPDGENADEIPEENIYFNGDKEESLIENRDDIQTQAEFAKDILNELNDCHESEVSYEVTIEKEEDVKNSRSMSDNSQSTIGFEPDDINPAVAVENADFSHPENDSINEDNVTQPKYDSVNENEDVFVHDDIECASIESDDQLELCEKQYIRSNVLSDDGSFITNDENDENEDIKRIKMLDEKGILDSNFNSCLLNEQELQLSSRVDVRIPKIYSFDDLYEASSTENVLQRRIENKTSSAENEELIALFRKGNSSITNDDPFDYFKNRSEPLLVESISSDAENTARFNESFRVFCSKLQDEFHKDDLQVPIVYIDEEITNKNPSSVTRHLPSLSQECIFLSDDGDKTHSDSNITEKDKKSTKNYLTAAFQSIAMALGKYQDSRPSKCNDELATSENDISSGTDKSESVTNINNSNDKKKNNKNEKPKRRLFNIFNHRTATLQTNNAFPLLTANIVNGKIKTDDELLKSGSETDLRKHTDTVTLITPMNNSTECTELEIKPIEMNELQCSENSTGRTSYNDNKMTVEEPMRKGGGYSADSPLSSDEQPSSSFTRKRRKRLKQLGKGVSIESSGFDEDGTKQKCPNNWYCTKCNNEPSFHLNENLNSSNEKLFARKLDKLMNETRAQFEHNFQKCDCGRTNYYGFVSHNHFDYVIKQLTRVRSEINTHFDLQAKRESELKLLLNNQVNEVRNVPLLSLFRGRGFYLGYFA